MKTKKDWALHHAERGFYVFRLIPDGKTPFRKGWQAEATNDPAQIEKLWSGRDANCNIGAFTTMLGDEAAIVVDVDMKIAHKNGDKTLAQLKADGYDFPETLTQLTPTGGRHIIYRAPWAVKQGAGVLGAGLDIRSRGGFIVMAGSVVEAGVYVTDMDEIADAPKWLFSKLSAAPTYEIKKRDENIVIDVERARQRAQHYIEHKAPSPEEGTRSDTAYKVTAHIKDLGCDEDASLELMLEWNDNLDDPMEEDQLISIVMNAFKHGQNDIGVRAVENLMSVREPVLPKEKPVAKVKPEEVEDEGLLHPFDELNKEFALVVSGGSHHILLETEDNNGQTIVRHIQEPTFHRMRSHLTIQLGDGKAQPITKAWLNDDRARRYVLGMVFEPKRAVDPRQYNLWKGFPFLPITEEEATFEEVRSFHTWKEHVLENICNGDEKQFTWLMAWCADLIQRPWRKPQASVVLQGEKGVGKNIFAEAIGQLFGDHSMLIDDPRYLNSNFNGHLEATKLLISDESNWGGDKSHEGHLKGLITGKSHNIERKGKESYKVRNILALIFMSNERWVVPASFDERRFYVTTVGNARKQDRKYFGKIVDLEGNMIGIRLLLDYLMKFDCTGIDTDVAPNTEGLLGQKLASLEPFEEWWYDCLTEGTLAGSVAKGVDFTKIHCDTFNRAFLDYIKGRHIRSRLPTADVMKKILHRVAPSMQRKALRNGSANEYFYVSAGLDALRSDWNKYIGSNINWTPIEDEGELECLT